LFHPAISKSRLHVVHCLVRRCVGLLAPSTGIDQAKGRTHRRQCALRLVTFNEGMREDAIVAMVLRPMLLRPDHPTWQRDASYSVEAAGALCAAFSRVATAASRPEEFLWACGLVSPWLNAEVAVRQRVRAFLLFARAHEADGAYADSLQSIDRALELAARSRALDDLVDLLFYHAKLERAQSRYDVAAEDLYACLELLDEHRGADGAMVDPALELELLAQLADYEFYLGHFHVAGDLAGEALRLAPQAPHKRLEAAAAERTQAHLDRLRGYSWDALHVMSRVAATYAQVPAPAISRGRLEYLFAEFALDIAECIPIGPASVHRTAPLRLARKHLDIAESLAKQVNDRPGRGLVTLAHARYSRIRGTNADRVARIEGVIRLSHRLDDHALLAQSFTALGEELAGQGAQEQALDCYRQTLGLLDGSAVAALGTVPRRRLLLAREMATDEETF
jgi:tetratricopeptide (TPR) repeat protein